LLAHIEQSEVDPAFVITHHLRLEEVPHGYKSFRNKKDNCVKIVLRPWSDSLRHTATTLLRV